MDGQTPEADNMEYDSDESLQDLSPDFTVKILQQSYTVAELADRKFRIRFDPDTELVFIYAKSKLCWSQDELAYRSVIVDREGNVLSAGFPKFFNYEEGEYTAPIDAALREAIATEHPGLAFTQKYDGTLIIRSVLNDEVVMRTRSTFSGRGHGEAAKELAEESYPQLLDPGYHPNISLLFEYIGPENRVIVSYDEPDLVLVGAIDHSSLKPLAWDELSEMDRCLRLAEAYPLAGRSIEEVNDFLSQQPDLIEGLVVRAGDILVKIKCEEYLKAHRLQGAVTYDRILGFIEEHDIQSWSHLQEVLHAEEWDAEWFGAARGYYDTYVEKQETLGQIAALCTAVVDHLRDDSILEDRERKACFARAISNASGSAKPFLFAAYDGQVDNLLYRKEWDLEDLREAKDCLAEIAGDPVVS